MKEKELFISAIETLLFSWGMDTPQEAIWGVNELLDWYEKEYNVELPERFEEEENDFDGKIERLTKNLK